MSFTVTATQGGSVAIGTSLLVKVLTGQAGSPLGTVASATSTTPSLAITPAATGSWVYGSGLGLAGTYTANGSTTYQANSSGGGLEYIQARTASTTTAATPVTVGGTAGVNGISICLCEIKAGTGLAEDASSPAVAFLANNTAVTTAAFTPPAGSLLVAVIATNGGGGTATVTVTDTSGLGLTWTEQVKQDGTGNGYSGIWTAAVPAAAAVTTAQPVVVPSLAATQAASW